METSKAGVGLAPFILASGERNQFPVYHCRSRFQKSEIGTTFAVAHLSHAKIDDFLHLPVALWQPPGSVFKSPETKMAQVASLRYFSVPFDAHAWYSGVQILLEKQKVGFDVCPHGNLRAQYRIWVPCESKAN